MVAWQTTTARETLSLLFECERCGCKREVLASATARGSALITALGYRGASQAAGARAGEAVRAAATRIVLLVACPSCNARRSSAVRATVAVQAIHLLWLAPVLGGLGVFAAVMMGALASSTFVAAFALGALGAIPIVVLLVRRRFRRADESVRFVQARAGGSATTSQGPRPFAR